MLKRPFQSHKHTSTLTCTHTHTHSVLPIIYFHVQWAYKAVQINDEYYAMHVYTYGQHTYKHIHINTNRECVWFRFDGQKRTTNSGELEAKVPNQFKYTQNLNAKIYTQYTHFRMIFIIIL